MSEYRMEFDQNYQLENEDGNNELEHYRIEISKLQDRLRDEAGTYKKRIAELEHEIYSMRKVTPGPQRSSEARPTRVQNNLSYQLYEKDLQIKELKTQNVKLRQIINNPDKVLIRRPDHFEAITEKEQEILRLRKTIQELQGKHDGQYLSQQKLKKQNEMLQHEIEGLKNELKRTNKTRFGFNEETLDPELMEAIRYKKELEICRREIATLEGVIKERDDEIEVWRKKYNTKNNYGLGYITQFKDMELELAEYREKAKELNKVVAGLQDQNERLLQERDRARISAEQRMPEVARWSKNDLEKTENLMRYHQSRDIAMNSMVPAAEKPTVHRTKRYDQFHFSDWESVM